MAVGFLGRGRREERLAATRLDLARRYQESERVRVPRDEFASWFEKASDAS
jgi:hypothetical protein